MRINDVSRRNLFCKCFGTVFFLGLLCVSRPAAAATCEGLAELKLPNTTITAAQSVAAGAFTVAGTTATYKELPAFCRVTGVIKPTSDSEIRFEVWMPSAGWNGKFQGIGNGGFAGSLSYPGLRYGYDRHRSQWRRRKLGTGTS
jgi:hypothetical protein